MTGNGSPAITKAATQINWFLIGLAFLIAVHHSAFRRTFIPQLDKV